MTQLTLSIPQSGLPNSTEDAKVASDLTQIQNVINGNLDAGNLSSTAGILRLAARNSASNTVAAAGELIITTAVPVTVTLPAPVANGLVGVISCGFASGASPTTVSGTNIFGVGANGVTSFKLGTPFATVVLQSDGTNWFIVSGQQDTGWVALALAGGVISAGTGYTPSSRLQGDIVRLKGVMQNNTGGTLAGNATWATIAAGSRPGVNLQFLTTAGSVISTNGQISTAGVLAVSNSVNAGGNFLLDGITFSLS